MKRIGIFWDYENCCTPARMSGYTVAGNVRRAAAALGDEISTFKAYVDVHLESSSKIVQQTELQASGVTLVHCPHASRKEVADRILLVDLVVFALECKDPASIVLITGDRDFTYAVSVLRMKGHDVFVIFPSGRSAHNGLKHLATGVLAWKTVLQCEGSALNFEDAVSNARRASTGSVPDRVDQEPKPQASISVPQHLIAHSTIPSKPSKAVLPTPLSAVLARHPTYASERRPVLMDTSNEAGLPSGDANGSHLDPKNIQQSSCSVLATNMDDITQDEPPQPATATIAKTIAHTATSLPSLSDNLSTRATPGLSSYIDYVGSSDSIMEIDDVPSHGAPYDPSAPLASRDSSKPSQGKESTFVFAGTVGAISSAAGKETFTVLIEVLLEERANGHMSTSCDILEGLLRKAKPTIYQDVGVSELKDYLELAQNASVVFFSDILWENRQGWVSLRNPQDYGSGSLSTLCRDRPFATVKAAVKASRRQKVNAALSSGANLLVGKDSVQSAVPRHTQVRGGARFIQLISVMRKLRTQGIKRIRVPQLYKPLQESGSGVRMSRAEVKAYIDLARTSGIICGGNDANDLVELYSDFY